MKKLSGFIVIIAVSSVLGGCIVSATPEGETVTLAYEDTQAFHINVFPRTGNTIIWFLDGVAVADVTGSTFNYCPEEMGVAEQITVRVKNPLVATVTRSWNINIETKWVISESQNDSDNDGEIDNVISYSYDWNWHVSKTEQDWDNDGTIESITTYSNSYDTNGNILSTETDQEDDGIIDTLTTYTYNEFERIEQITYDYSNDGTVDYVLTFTYDANGNEIRIDYDTNNDGVIDRENHLTNDSDGNLTDWESYNVNDGTINSMGNLSYSEDSLSFGRILNPILGVFETNLKGDHLPELSEQDIDADGVIDLTEFYTFDKENGTAEIDSVFNGDTATSIIIFEEVAFY